MKSTILYRLQRLFGSVAVILTASLFLVSSPVLAVDDLGLFELDGNAVQNATAPPDDWETLYFGGGSANVYTGVTADPAPLSIFTGGRKDIQDIDQWGWKDGSVPDKGDITNAYAAAYDYNGDLIVYFGADRVINVGDTFLGFWFFKAEVTTLPDGSFDGLHTPGDTLVLVNFPQASNAVPLVQVVEWDPTCSKADSNNPQVGDCAAANLRLRAGVEGAGAICSPSTPGDQPACAITNDVTTPSPWPYTSKDGFVDEFPFETFFSGGINLTQVIGGDSCFSSFMAESRSSSSFTASLKDFVLDAFPLCSISVSKACTNPTLNAAEDMIIYDINGTVTNDGFGTVYNIDVSDAPPFDAGSLTFFADPSSLAGGYAIDYSATITVPLASNGPSDEVTATANSQSDDSGTALLDTAQATCPQLQISPSLSVSKNCSSIVTTLADPVAVVVQVNVNGEVCNTGDTKLTNVTVTDNEAGTLLSGVTLAKAGEDPTCMSYSGSYIPTERLIFDGSVETNNPTEVYFRDQVMAGGLDIFGATVGPAIANAICPLCACDPCEP